MEGTASADSTVSGPAAIKTVMQDQGKAPSSILSDRATRVAAKEEAVSKALGALDAIKSNIKNGSKSSSVMDLHSWKELVEELEKEADDFEYLVGTAGDTGSGKSTLLNVLVNDTADIAPSSQNGACTATVCCFSYPKPGNSQKKYHAEVHIKSRTTVDRELHAFFQELNDVEDRAKNEGSLDMIAQAELERLHEYLDLIAGWSGIKVDQLQMLGRNEESYQITLKCNDAKELFGLKDPEDEAIVHKSADNPREFLLKVKPYVSSAGKSAQGLRWPIVEKVHIFVEADILRNRVVLVDLPGEMDAVEARSRVAKNYYEKLDRIMVVAPGDRAYDNKTAIELLREDQVIDMEADGKMQDNSLCVVVTKVDQMDWQNFVGTELSTEAIPSALAHSNERYEAKKEQLEKIDGRIESLTQDVNQRSDDEKSRSSPTLREAYEVRSKIKKELKYFQSLCLRACIDIRSEDIKKAFQDYFDRIRNSLYSRTGAKVSTDLDVFPISSKAYRSHTRGQPFDAFEDIRSTGIGDLREWIRQGSLPRREHHADGILHRCNVLLDAIGGWANDGGMLLKRLPQDAKKKLESNLRSRREKMLKELRNYCENLNVTLGRLHANYSRQMNALDFSCEQRLVTHVEGYQRDGPAGLMHWSTYAACIRRQGEMFKTTSKPSRTHDWQAKTYHFYWMARILPWIEAYGQRLDDKRHRFDSNVHRRLNDYLQNVMNCRSLPQEYLKPYRDQAYQVENLYNQFSVRTTESMRNYKSRAKALRHESRKRLASLMAPAYQKANAASGSGKFKMQKEIMKTQAEELRSTIFATVSSTLEDDLKQARADIKKAMKGHCTQLVQGIQTFEDRLVNQVCSAKKPKPKIKNDAEVTELKLKAFVQQRVQEWRQFWVGLESKLPPPVLDAPAEDSSSDLESKSEGIMNKQEKNKQHLKQPAVKDGKKETAGAKRKAKAKPQDPSKVTKKARNANGNGKAKSQPVKPSMQSTTKGLPSDKTAIALSVKESKGLHLGVAVDGKTGEAKSVSEDKGDEAFESDGFQGMVDRAPPEEDRQGGRYGQDE